MQTNKENFLKWVSDPARTNDELFTVEILLEQSRGQGWPHDFVDTSFDAKQERARARYDNPAHRPSLHLDELRTLIERVEEKKYFSGGTGDRPLRDLRALRFFPFLTNVRVEPSDVTDFTPLASLAQVTSLSIADYNDLYGCHPICLAQCGAMPNLERLHLALRHPWPDLRGMSAWPKLSYISYNGSVLALEDIETLPAAREVLFKTWPGGRGELRNLQRLPLLPEVRLLTIEGASSLDGIARYPTTLNLELAGCYRDLSPLAQMEKVTALTLIGEHFQDLQPLTLMKSLRELVLQREWPIDLSPLTECPQLRRVSFKHSAMMRTEVAALNAALPPEADDFLAPEPRPLPELKCYRVLPQSAAVKNFSERSLRAQDVNSPFFDGDAALMTAARRVFRVEMQAKFDELLGRGWGNFDLPFTSLKRYRDSTRLRELIDIVRDYQRRVVQPFPVTFIVEPHGDMSDDLAEIEMREAEANAPDEDYLIKYHDEESVLEENEEARERRQRRYELLKREHLFKLLGEEEASVILNLPKEDDLEVEEPEEEEPAFENDPQDDEDGGGVAIAPPPPSPPKGEAEEDLSEALMFYLDIWEECVVSDEHWADRAEYCLGQKFTECTPSAS